MAKPKQPTFTLYTDGSFHSKTKNGGYASVVKETNEIVCGNETNTTNNKMELQAVIRGLAHLPDDSNVVVHSDSQYVINAFNKRWINNWKKNGWKTANGQDVKNKQEWETLAEQKERHKKVKFVWVKGHNGDHYNEAADQFANVAAQHLTKK